MKKIFIVAVSLFFAINLSAQTHKEAKALLDAVKEKTTAFTNQKIVFKNTIDSPTGNEAKPRSTRKMSGIIYIKGDSYRLIMNDLIYIFDGKTMHIIDPEIEEVDVMDMEDDSPVTPASVLDGFDNNYSYKMGKKKTIGDQSIQYVHLKPNGASELKEVIVGIDSKTKLLYSYQMIGINDVITEISISEYKTNLELEANTFKFDKNEWSGFEIND